MKDFVRFLALVTAILVQTQIVKADDVTPTPTATPTSVACAPVASCVDTGMSSLLTSCLAATPECQVSSVDRFGVSAGTIAARALALRHCSTKKTKGACNVCYQAAKLPLHFRYDGKLFHGLLANAVSLIEKERKATCLHK